MKGVACALILALFLVGTQTAYAGPDLWASSFCAMSYYDADGKPRGSGTAFPASYGGQDILLSAAHVFSDKDEWVELRSYYNSIHWARIVALDRAKDIAILTWAHDKPYWVRNLTLAPATYTYRFGQKLLVFGCPAGKQLWERGGNLTNASIISWTMDERNLVLTSNIPLIPGDSGGPILSSEGAVVGIAVALTAVAWEHNPDGGPPIPRIDVKGWFVPISIIHQFLSIVL